MLERLRERARHGQPLEQLGGAVGEADAPLEPAMLEHPLDEGRWPKAVVETQFFQISNLFGDLGVIGSGGKVTETLYELTAGFGLDGSYGGRGRSSS